jgi:glycoprotein-N-acetylgalactosamine 3-beta-galactosyltransferase
MAHVPQKMNVADYLSIEVKVLCVVMLDNLIEIKRKVTYLQESWVQRCNSVIYVLVTNDNIEGSKIETGRDNVKIAVFANTIDLFHHLQMSQDFDTIDWILQAPESSYIVLENLRHMLYPYEASWPVFVAHNATIVRNSTFSITQ